MVIAVADGYAEVVLYTAQRMEASDVAELARLFEGRPKESLASTHEGVELQRDNNIRAGWAARALIAYASHLGGQSLVDELETVTGDLLGDLLHLFDALGLDWEEIRERGERFHREEVFGDV
ncbi:hypothetical protein [Mycobacterium servetii]|uniref:Uncharacterized protein n=1 Tax=Mycobacterium servetii TaxID=3237418 RepID=A0ABV4C8V0_9MYCO